METIAVLDFGGQYTHLIANRIRRLGVYSEILPNNAPADSLSHFKGIILSGGPYSVKDNDSPKADSNVFGLGLPVLGLCYGHQLMAQDLGGGVSRGDVREYGVAKMSVTGKSPLFEGLSGSEQVWMSHGDTVDSLADGFTVLGSSADCEHAAVGDDNRKLYGLQFHPEVTDTPNGMKILENFIAICGCKREWNSEAFFQEIRTEILEKCGDRNVFLLVSGGVDSTVAFALLNKTLGSQRVLGLHIDNGLMRYKESEDILEYMHKNGFDNLKIVDATDVFLSALKGVYDAEEKREIIGTTFIKVKESAMADLGLNVDEWLLAQGTIYPDTIESAGTEHADRIKTHHNRVDVVLELLEKGLVVEPLAQLYKDEVRNLGETLGLPHDLVWRHPFPGPGLGVRALCYPGGENDVAPAVDRRVGELAAECGYEATVLPVKSVGVQGDGRTYAHPVLLIGQRNWGELERISTRITNNVSQVNRVVFGLNVSSKPSYKLVESYLTRDRLDKLRAIDHLVTTVLREENEYESVWQAPVVILPLVNEHGEQCVVLRPIMSQEAMTAHFIPLGDTVIDRIVDGAKEIEGIGDLFFDITHKPPGTIEWE